MPLLLIGLLAFAYFASSSSVSSKLTVPGPGDPGFVGPPAPNGAGQTTNAQGNPSAPPPSFSPTASVVSGRFIVTTDTARTDQTYIEGLFTTAAVDGWYIGPAHDASGAIIELRDTDLQAAWVRLLVTPGVTFVDQYAGQ